MDANFTGSISTGGFDAANVERFEASREAERRRVDIEEREARVKELLNALSLEQKEELLGIQIVGIGAEQ